MRTPDGKWTVEVLITRGGQPFRVKNLHSIPVGTMGAPGQLVAAIAEIRAILGADYDTLVEDRSGRSDGGRLS